MDIKFSDTKEEYLYYENLVSLYPEKIYVPYYTKNNELTYKYQSYTSDTFCKSNLKNPLLASTIDPLWIKYNIHQKHDIRCLDSFSDSSEDKYIKRNKRNTNLNKIKIMTLSSLVVVSAVLANNYLSDK